MENRRVCKRCLTREMAGQEEYFKNMQDYIEHLDENIKTEDGLYESRLSVCKSCDLLWEGMCRRCGCYVEMRAALRQNSCPDRHW